MCAACAPRTGVVCGALLASGRMSGEISSDTFQVDEPTGSLWVTVDHRGLLADVRVNHRWADRIDPGAFAGTLFGMYTTAVHTALAAGPSTPDDEPVTLSRPPDPELSYADWVARTRATLEDNETRLLAALRAEPATNEETELHSEHGYVTLHLRGANPVGLTANTDVLGYANTEVLRRDVLEVFTDAGLAAED